MYSYTPILRVTPLVGNPISFDFTTIDRMTIARWTPEPEFTQKTTVRRKVRNIKYGWRLRLFFVFVVEPGSASDLTLKSIAYHVNRNGHVLEMTMTNTAYPYAYREVVLADWRASNVEEKNALCVYQVEFVAVNLLSEEPIPPEFAESPPTLSGWIGDPT